MSQHLKLFSTAVLAVIVAIALAACGGSGDSEDQASAEDTDGAFIVEMVPHHESAIEMARMATEQAQHPEIQELARGIISSQGEEIDRLTSIHRRLFNEPLSEVDHGTLGLSDPDSGMSHDASALDRASPFDREFIDMMIPHHQGAIRMARVELDRGQDEELKVIARSIIVAQSAEIEDMNQWRQQWYDAPSPAGGVPAANQETPSHEEMGH